MALLIEPKQIDGLQLPSYATRTAAAAASISSAVQSLVTGGYAVVGDGGNASYIRDTSLKPGGFQSADGTYWSYVANGALRLEQFGGNADYDQTTGTWATDNSPAIAIALSVVSVNFIPNFAFYEGGPTIEFLYGSYYFSQTIQCFKTVVLQGKGCGVNGGSGTALFFAINQDAICLNSFGSSPATPGAAGSIIRDMRINALAGGTSGHGINAQSRPYLSNLVIVGFTGGDGVHIDSTLSAGANCDGWFASTLRIISCKSGFTTVGSDSNAGTAIALDVSTCSVTGISDASFLGNTYIGCEVAACTLYAYETTNANAQNQFFGCYTEGGQTCNVNSPAVIWGGFLAFNNAHAGNAVRIWNGSIQTLNIFGSIGFGRTGYSVTLNPTTGGLANLTLTGDAQPWEFPILINGSWILQRPGTSGLALTTSLSSVTAGGPIPVAPGNFIFGGGVYIGSVSGGFPPARLHDTDTAIPTIGLHVKGDIRWNNTPIPGGPVGWICITTGAIATTAWVASTAYAVGALVTNDSGKSYVCTTAGTSAASGGPTGTGTSITDGTAVWSFEAAFAFAPFGDSILETTSAYAGGTIAAGAVGAISTGITLTGAALGDLVSASLNEDLQGCILNAWVSAANTVKYQLVNPAGAAGSVTLAAGTVKLRVRK